MAGQCVLRAHRVAARDGRHCGLLGLAGAALLAKVDSVYDDRVVCSSWQDDVIVTRAPGRLDVMGGIADYSGSLVLQLPLAEACHVAVQRHPLGKQRLWRHMEARQASRFCVPADMVRGSLHVPANSIPHKYTCNFPACEASPWKFSELRQTMVSSVAHSAHAQQRKGGPQPDAVRGVLRRYFAAVVRDTLLCQKELSPQRACAAAQGRAAAGAARGVMQPGPCSAAVISKTFLSGSSAHSACAQQRKGGPQPALRVVSFGADRANRGPAFDMDLPELLTPDGGPIAYEDARAYFHADPAHRHASAKRRHAARLFSEP